MHDEDDLDPATFNPTRWVSSKDYRGRYKRMAPEWVENGQPNSAGVLAFDPGGTTGWCVMRWDLNGVLQGKKSWEHSIQVWSTGEIKHENENVLVESMVKKWEPAAMDCAVVLEDFILMSEQRDRALLSPVRIMAAFEYALWAKRGDMIKTWRQQPSMKTTANDDRLKTWGLYRSAGGQGHARDATRHAVLFVRRLCALDARGAALREEFARVTGFEPCK